LGVGAADPVGGRPDTPSDQVEDERRIGCGWGESRCQSIPRRNASKADRGNNSVRGVRAAVMYSLIATAKRNGIDPQA
jgi:hypothetical protein